MSTNPRRWCFVHCMCCLDCFMSRLKLCVLLQTTTATETVSAEPSFHQHNLHHHIDKKVELCWSLLNEESC